MALGWKILVTAIAMSLTHISVHAKELEGVKFEDQLDLGAAKLVLNGVGLRTKKRFGMNFKVYVGGLYLAAKSDKPEKIIGEASPKVLKMVFLRSIDKDTMKEGIEEGFMANCAPDCEATRGQLKELKDLMGDMKDKGEFIIQFDKDSVKVNFNGKQTKSGIMAGAPFRDALLRLYIGEKPPTEELKRGLLGL